MNMTRIEKIIKKPKEEVAFCYNTRKPIFASIFRRKIVRRKVLKKTVEKKCKTCGHVTTKNIYTSKMGWSELKLVKQIEKKTKKSAIKLALKWFNSYSHRKLRKEKVKLT